VIRWADDVTRARHLLTLLGIDLASKLAAYRLLPHDGVVNTRSFFQLGLVLNNSGEGTWSQKLVHDRAVATLPATAASYAILALALILVPRLDIRRWRFWIYACAYALPFLLGHAILRYHPLPLSRLHTMLIVRASGAGLLCACWSVSTSWKWRTTFLLAGAAALGNLLSLALPPFAIVDFIYSKPIRVLAGYGIFNVADVYVLAAVVLAAVFLAHAAAKRLIGAKAAIRRIRRVTISEAHDDHPYEPAEPQALLPGQFRCSGCEAPVNFGASACLDCEQPFVYHDGQPRPATD
jgi:hypothetical protein